MHLNLTTKQIEKFWSNVDRSGGEDACWLWTGGIQVGGYGTICINYRHRMAHRISYLIAHGEIPDGLCVCHSCDNPPCVNPRHLWAGTQRENIADMDRKGKRSGNNHWTRKKPGGMPSGERHYNAKVNDDVVKEIRHRHENGETYAELAPEFGISYRSVYDIVQRLTWKHVP